MSLERQPQRFLPFFPTLKEIKEGIPFISDHGALLIEQKTDAGTIKMLTLNVHAPDPNSSGFAANEKDEEIIQRGINTIKFLMKMIDEHHLDAIMTQETYFLDNYFNKINRNDIRALLLSELDKRGWKLQENGDQNAPKDLMTLYNPKRLTLSPVPKDDKLATDKLSHFARQCLKFYTQKLIFKVSGSEKSIAINHVHWPHHDIPRDAEAILKSLKNSIVIGDFNNRIVIPRKLFLVNNVVPPNFRKGKQGADFTDGAFLVDENGKVHQSAQIRVIDYLTGQIHTDKVPDLKKLTDEQNQELLKPCLFVSIAKEHQSISIDEKGSQFFESNGMQLRQSINALNQKGLAILYTSNDVNQQNLSEFLKRRFEGVVTNSKRFDESTGQETTYVSFFPTEQLQNVMQEIQIYLKNIAVLSKALPLVQAYFDKIDSEIKKIEDKKPDDKELPIKKSKRTAAELLKSKIEGWIANGSAGVQNPFAYEKEMMQLANPDIKSGASVSIFNKQFKVPRLTKLFDTLIKLDKELVYVPLSKTVVDDHKSVKHKS